jgi:hypothetical protein
MNIYLCEIASHLYEMTINPSKYSTDLSSYTLHLVTLASNLNEMVTHLGEMNIYLSETQTGTRFKRAPVLIENRKSVVAGNNFPGNC